MNITKPTLSASLDDQSQVDESLKQDHVTINASNGATINANTRQGGQERLTWRSMIFLSIFHMLPCALLGLVFFLGRGNPYRINNDFDQETHSEIEALLSRSKEQNDMLQRQVDAIREETRKEAKSMKEQLKVAVSQAREGTIWLLRDDILKTLDLYEVQGEVSQKWLKRIKDEVEFYFAIGGNHDVKDRWDAFKANMLAGVVKVIPDRKR